MSFTLHLEDIENIVFESNNQQYNIDESGTKELYVSYNYPVLKGWYKELSFDNFKIAYGNTKLTKETNLLFEFEEETVEMHFTLKGASTTKAQSIQDFSINSNSHNIFYCDGLKGKHEWLAKDIFIFEVNLTPSFFIRYLPFDKIFEKFKNQIQKKEVGMMNRNNYPISHKMHTIIQQIINCNLKNTFRRLFIESKILELLMLQMQQIQSYNTLIKKEEKHGTCIVDKMHYAKELISRKIENPLSLAELSTLLNTNECTLKSAFKSTFGTTVFNYVKKLKMEKAKSMLLDYNNYSVSEVSDAVGYKNPQHFTAAFKKHFGFVPSKLKI